MAQKKNEPIIIIAAARSGTKMLRYVLSASDEITGYPYDANYIWKYGNYRIKHDEIQPNSIDETKKNKIRRFFLRICEKESRPRLLEKTVSNSLRIPFVRSVFPDSKIVHLYRNGLDVTASSRRCWQASARSERIQSKEDRARKLREFPITMAWPYLLEYMKVYGKKALLKQAHVDSWGPRYKEIDQDIRTRSLIEICAIQWARCVEHCCLELGRLEKGSDYINVSYEELIADPKTQLEKIVEFVGLPDGEKVINRGREVIRPNYVQSWKNDLSGDEYEMIFDIISKSQRQLDALR